MFAASQRTVSLCEKQTSTPNQDSYRDLTEAGGTACVPVAVAEVENGTTGMSSSSNFTNVPRRTIPARSRASQFVNRMC